ncbi:hypothetical protein AAFF_G00116400 [Aldrovandia affinis]|uniref:Uncharacterized protein n=1 Tax=Aldrovandia affinis TaxID=143900 RepID=A0AAD7T1I5_9TELE|nr:hypothetical protein AAFF_G00116400 [Aldrovandia affinis]
MKASGTAEASVRGSDPLTVPIPWVAQGSAVAPLPPHPAPLPTLSSDAFTVEPTSPQASCSTAKFTAQIRVDLGGICHPLQLPIVSLLCQATRSTPKTEG